MSIYLIEIPHQRAPRVSALSAWQLQAATIEEAQRLASLHGDQQAADMLGLRTTTSDGYVDLDLSDLDDEVCERIIGHDLHTCIVASSADEARRRAPEHQRAAVLAGIAACERDLAEVAS